MNTAVYDMRDLFFGHSVTGPAIIIDAATFVLELDQNTNNPFDSIFPISQNSIFPRILLGCSTIVVEPECRAVITKRGDIEIFVGDQTRLPIGQFASRLLICLNRSFIKACFFIQRSQLFQEEIWILSNCPFSVIDSCLLRNKWVIFCDGHLFQPTSK